MTAAKAQACVSAIIGAGFDAVVHQKPDGTWTVRALSANFTISSTQIEALVTSQAVLGNVGEVEFS